jgi:Peptidase C13 family
MASSAGLRRQNSARDKSKALPDLSGPALKQNSTSHLVVCGATGYKQDYWLFGDFLGFVDTFKKVTPSIHGDFVNCFPLGAYFELSCAPDIKFGRRKESEGAGWESGDEIAIYTKWQYDHREAWWTQVNEPSWRSVKSDVLRWIESRARNAKPADIVTIVLIGHGNTDGIFIGGLPLSPSELATACANFAAGVQVNIIIKACSSGAFANAFRVSGQQNLYVHTSSKDRHEKSFSDRRSISGRVRNSLFGSSFIETLGLMRDEEEIWTLGKQKQKLAYDLDNPLVPELRRSHPQVASDSPLKRIMWDIMYRDYIDLSFDRAPTNARRVLTPPNEALRIQTQKRAPSASLVPSYAAAEVVLSREMEGLDTDFPEGGDIGILDQLFALDRFPKARRHSAVEELVRTLSY